MNVAHIISSINYGGSVRHVIELLNYNKQLQMPIKQHLVVLQDSKCDVSNLIPRDVNVLLCNIKNYKTPRYFFEINKIVKYINKNNIHLIHTHDANPNFIGFFISKKTNVALVSTLHNFEWFYYRTNAIDVYKRIKDKIRLKGTNKIIIISKDLGDFILDKTNTSFNILSYIPHGLNENDYICIKKSNLSISNKTINIAVIGRYSIQKNHIFLINVLKNLGDNISNFHFIFAGDGELKEKIIDLIDKYHLENYITLLGNIDWVPSLISSVDAVAMPSLWEGCPLVALESMMCEKPIIANNVLGLRNVMKDKVNGYLIDNNINDWTEFFLNLNINEFTKLGKKGKKIALKRYSYKRMIKEIYDLYKSIT